MTMRAQKAWFLPQPEALCSATLNGRAVLQDFAPEGRGHEYLRKVLQQSDTAEFVEMNERSGIADDQAPRRISRGHLS
jgi:hypothetical protein